MRDRKLETENERQKIRDKNKKKKIWDRKWDTEHKRQKLEITNSISSLWKLSKNEIQHPNNYIGIFEGVWQKQRQRQLHF